MMLPSLEELSHYQNDRVVLQFFHKNQPITLQESYQLFQDLKGFLWLNLYRNQQGKQTPLFGPLLTMDEMWHTFILHTQDYHQFCDHYFGAYVHHVVEPVGQETQMDPDILSDLLEDCFTYLGEAWVDRYFQAMFIE